jgi:hypothetical protein
MSSAISSCKNPRKRISPGSPQDLLLRTCTASCKDLLERNLAKSPQEPVHARFRMKIPQAKGLRPVMNPKPRSKSVGGRYPKGF